MARWIGDICARKGFLLEGFIQLMTADGKPKPIAINNIQSIAYV
jgi:hypothetical protein